MDCQTVIFVIVATLLLTCDGQSDRETIIKNSQKARRLPALDVCGLSASTFEVKIINGKPADLGAYPWMANLGYVNRPRQSPQWLCAGSLITNRYVLTAAHCIDPKIVQAKKQWTLTTVRLGDLDLNPDVKDDANPVDYDVESYVFHEEYNNEKKINDIGLVRTKKEVVFTAFIRPICLPPLEFQLNEFIGFSPIVAGWGKSITNSNAGTRLLEAEVEIKDTNNCKANITSVLRQAIIDQRVLCASSPGKDSCQGDSGGPLMFHRRLKNSPPASNGNMFLMGIVSYGYGCALEGYPGVYTRVTQYMAWIVGKMDI